MASPLNPSRKRRYPAPLSRETLDAQPLPPTVERPVRLPFGAASSQSAYKAIRREAEEQERARAQAAQVKEKQRVADERQRQRELDAERNRLQREYALQTDLEKEALERRGAEIEGRVGYDPTGRPIKKYRQRTDAQGRPIFKPATEVIAEHRREQAQGQQGATPPERKQYNAPLMRRRDQYGNVTEQSIYKGGELRLKDGKVIQYPSRDVPGRTKFAPRELSEEEIAEHPEAIDLIMSRERNEAEREMPKLVAREEKAKESAARGIINRYEAARKLQANQIIDRGQNGTSAEEDAQLEELKNQERREDNLKLEFEAREGRKPTAQEIVKLFGLGPKRDDEYADEVQMTPEESLDSWQAPRPEPTDTRFKTKDGQWKQEALMPLAKTLAIRLAEKRGKNDIRRKGAGAGIIDALDRAFNPWSPNFGDFAYADEDAKVRTAEEQIAMITKGEVGRMAYKLAQEIDQTNQQLEPVQAGKKDYAVVHGRIVISPKALKQDRWQAIIDKAYTEGELTRDAADSARDEYARTIETAKDQAAKKLLQTGSSYFERALYSQEQAIGRSLNDKQRLQFARSWLESDPTTLEWATNLTSAFAGGAIRFVGSGIKGLAIEASSVGIGPRDAKTGDGYGLGQSLQNLANYQQDPRAQDFTTSVAEGGGSFAGFLGISLLTRGAGLSTLTAAGASGTFGGLSMGADIYDRARDYGVSHDDALAPFVAGNVLGWTDLIPVENLLSKAPGAKRGFKQALAEMLLQAVVEGGQEGFQELGTNATIQAFVDEHQELFEGANESAGVGGTIGIVSSAVMSLVNKARQRGRLMRLDTEYLQLRQQTDAQVTEALLSDPESLANQYNQQSDELINAETAEAALQLLPPNLEFTIGNIEQMQSIHAKEVADGLANEQVPYEDIEASQRTILALEHTRQHIAELHQQRKFEAIEAALEIETIALDNPRAANVVQAAFKARTEQPLSDVESSLLATSHPLGPDGNALPVSFAETSEQGVRLTPEAVLRLNELAPAAMALAEEIGQELSHDNEQTKNTEGTAEAEPPAQDGGETQPEPEANAEGGGAVGTPEPEQQAGVKPKKPARPIPLSKPVAIVAPGNVPPTVQDTLRDASGRNEAVDPERTIARATDITYQEAADAGWITLTPTGDGNKVNVEASPLLTLEGRKQAISESYKKYGGKQEVNFVSLEEAQSLLPPMDAQALAFNPKPIFAFQGKTYVLPEVFDETNAKSADQLQQYIDRAMNEERIHETQDSAVRDLAQESGLSFDEQVKKIAEGLRREESFDLTAQIISEYTGIEDMRQSTSPEAQDVVAAFDAWQASNGETDFISGERMVQEVGRYMNQRLSEEGATTEDILDRFWKVLPEEFRALLQKMADAMRVALDQAAPEVQRFVQRVDELLKADQAKGDGRPSLLDRADAVGGTDRVASQDDRGPPRQRREDARDESDPRSGKSEVLQLQKPSDGTGVPSRVPEVSGNEEDASLEGKKAEGVQPAEGGAEAGKRTPRRRKRSVNQPEKSGEVDGPLSPGIVLKQSQEAWKDLKKPGKGKTKLSAAELAKGELITVNDTTFEVVDRDTEMAYLKPEEGDFVVPVKFGDTIHIDGREVKTPMGKPANGVAFARFFSVPDVTNPKDKPTVTPRDPEQWSSSMRDPETVAKTVDTAAVAAAIRRSADVNTQRAMARKVADILGIPHDLAFDEANKQRVLDELDRRTREGESGTGKVHLSGGEAVVIEDADYGLVYKAYPRREGTRDGYGMAIGRIETTGRAKVKSFPGGRMKIEIENGTPKYLQERANISQVIPGFQNQEYIGEVNGVPVIAAENLEDGDVSLGELARWMIENNAVKVDRSGSNLTSHDGDNYVIHGTDGQLHLVVDVKLDNFRKDVNGNVKMSDTIVAHIVEEDVLDNPALEKAADKVRPKAAADANAGTALPPAFARSFTPASKDDLYQYLQEKRNNYRELTDAEWQELLKDPALADALEILGQYEPNIYDSGGFSEQWGQGDSFLNKDKLLADAWEATPGAAAKYNSWIERADDEGMDWDKDTPFPDWHSVAWSWLGDFDLTRIEQSEMDAHVRNIRRAARFNAIPYVDDYVSELISDAASHPGLSRNSPAFARPLTPPPAFVEGLFAKATEEANRPREEGGKFSSPHTAPVPAPKSWLGGDQVKAAERQEWLFRKFREAAERKAKGKDFEVTGRTVSFPMTAKERKELLDASDDAVGRIAVTMREGETPEAAIKRHYERQAEKKVEQENARSGRASELRAARRDIDAYLDAIGAKTYQFIDPDSGELRSRLVLPSQTELTERDIRLLRNRRRVEGRSKRKSIPYGYKQNLGVGPQLRRTLTASEESVRKLVEDNLALAGHMANQFSNIPGIERDDAFQEGAKALLRVAETWDDRKGKFGAYAAKAIRNHLINTYRKQDKVSDRFKLTLDLPAFEDTEVSDTRTNQVPDERTPQADAQAIVADANRIANGVLKQFKLKKPHMHRAWTLLMKGYNQERIAKEMGMSQSRVSKILEVTRNYLRERLEARGITAGEVAFARSFQSGSPAFARGFSKEAATQTEFKMTPELRNHPRTVFQSLFSRETRWRDLFSRDKALRKAALSEVGGAFESTMINLRMAHEDHHYQLRKVQGRIANATGDPLPAMLDAHEKMQGYEGRVEARQLEIDRTYRAPLMKKLVAYANKFVDDEVGAAFESLEDYTYAWHAPERNQHMVKINPNEWSQTNGDDTTWGSGMGDDTAAAIRQKAKDAGQEAALEEMRQILRSMLDAQMEERVKAGLLSRDQANAWKALYPNYIPLRGFADVDVDHSDRSASEEFQSRNKGAGGFDTRAKESPEAYGRASRAANLIANAFAIANEATLRVEKNEIGKALGLLVQQNREPGYWQVDPIKELPYVDPNTGLIKYRQLPNEPNESTFKYKQGGQTYAIVFQTEDGKSIAQALRNMDGPQLGGLQHTLGWLSRAFSMINTSLDPEFVINNALKDVQTALAQAQQYDIEGITAAMVKGWFPALKALARGGMEGVASDNVPKEWRDAANEFVEHGGRVAFFDFQDVATMNMTMQKDLRAMSGKLSNLNAAERYAHKAFEGISWMNNVVDNATRLTFYKAIRDRGVPPQKAVALAKNLTVNFNKRGSWTPFLNALYPFYGVGIKGQIIMLHSLRSKNVRRVAAGLVVLGFTQALLNVLLSPEDEDGRLLYDTLDEFERERSWIVVNPFWQPGSSAPRAFKAPMPYGWNVVPYLGTQALAVMRGKKSFGRASIEWVSAVNNSWNPLSSGDLIDEQGAPTGAVRMASPMVTDIAVDWAMNRDFLGRAIVPDYYGDKDPTPMHKRHYDNVSTISKEATRFLNKITGGNGIVRGVVPGKGGMGADLSPEIVDYAYSQYTGGPGRMIARVVGLFDKIASGEETEWNDIPFARKLVHDKSEISAAQSFYYDVIKPRVFAVDNYIKSLEKNARDEYLAANPGANVKGFRVKGAIQRAQDSARSNYLNSQREGLALASLRNDMKSLEKQLKILRGQRDSAETPEQRQAAIDQMTAELVSFAKKYFEAMATKDGQK